MVPADLSKTRILITAPAAVHAYVERIVGADWRHGGDMDAATCDVWLVDARHDLAGFARRVSTLRSMAVHVPVVIVTTRAPPAQVEELETLEAIVVDCPGPTGDANDLPDAAIVAALRHAAARARLPRRDPYMAALFDAATSACLLVDARGRVEYANARARAWSAARAGELVPGTDFMSCARAWFGEACAPLRPAWMEARQGRGGTLQFDAEGTPFQTRLEPVGDDGRVVVSVRDVTRRKQAEARLRHEITHDRLTGLPNRARMMDAIGAALSSDRTGGVSIVAIDVDRFKTVNDTLGLPVGDRLLVAFGQRMSALVPEGGLLARSGGDEFAMLLPGGADATRLAGHVCDAAREPFVLDDFEVFVSASVGIVRSGADGNADDLLRAASIAVYAAKEDGGDRMVLHDASMDSRAHERLALETDLRAALASDAFDLAYQPIFDTRTRACVGIEALLRWNHPERGDVPPETYLELSEELGIIGRITALVLERATRAFAEAALHGDARLHVNVSATDLTRLDLVRDVEQALHTSGLPGHRLVVEFSETALMRAPEAAVRVLSQLRAMGVRTAIDDFGTGYSSLAWLSRLPLDALKIDGSFVRAAGGGVDIVRTVVSFAEAFGFLVIAEGVETTEQLEHIAAVGCVQAQGFGLGEPVDASSLPRWLDATANGARA